MATINADKRYTRSVPIVEMSIVEEERLLDSFVRCYEEHGEEIMAEMQWWFDLPGPPLPNDDWSDVIPEGE
jgi:hypothetical protein